MDGIGLGYVYGHVGFGNSQGSRLAVVDTVNNEHQGAFTRSVVPILEAVSGL